MGKRRKMGEKMISGRKIRSKTGKTGPRPDLGSRYGTIKIGSDLRFCTNSAYIPQYCIIKGSFRTVRNTRQTIKDRNN